MIPYAKRDPQTELRTLIYNLLRSGLPSDVELYEYVPWSKKPPHVSLGDARATTDDTKDFYVDVYELHVEIITLYGGTMENIGLMDDVKAILTQAIIDSEMCFGADSRFILIDFTIGECETKAVKDNQFEQSTIITYAQIRQTR